MKRKRKHPTAHPFYFFLIPPLALVRLAVLLVIVGLPMLLVVLVRLPEIAGAIGRGIGRLVARIFGSKPAPAETSVPQGPSTARDRWIAGLVSWSLGTAGGAAKKIGQVLAQAPKLIGAEAARACGALQDGGSPRSVKALERKVRRDKALAGQHPILTELEWARGVWTATASSAAVFRVPSKVTSGGEPRPDVAVKLILTSCRLAYLLDHALLVGISYVLEPITLLIWVLRPLRIPEQIREVADGYRDQLDLRLEKESSDLLRRDFEAPFNRRSAERGYPLRIKIPEVFAATRDVLVMEFISGTRARAVLDEVLAPVRPSGVVAAWSGHATLLVEAISYMVLNCDTQHGDPHAGNVFFTPTEVVFLDFGLVARLGARQRTRTAAGLLSLAAGDADGLARSFERGAPRPPRWRSPEARAAFVADIGSHIHNVAVALERNQGDALPLGELVKGVLGSLRRHAVEADPEFVLLNEALIAAQGFVGPLTPGFDLVRAIRDEVISLYRTPGAMTNADRWILFPSMVEIARRNPSLADGFMDEAELALRGLIGSQVQLDQVRAQLVHDEGELRTELAGDDVAAVVWAAMRLRDFLGSAATQRLLDRNPWLGSIGLVRGLLRHEPPETSKGA